MIEAYSLTKTYSGIPAVKDATFSIGRGEVLGCLGPNGSGKSTTVKMLVGLLEPSRGRILCGGRSIREDLAAYKRRLGYVPEEAHLYGDLSGLEYLELIGSLRAMDARVVRERSEALLELLALRLHRHTPIASYSKGMRQRILICAALLHDPDLLIFDEPLSGLDVTTALVFRHLIAELARHGKAILYSSHVLEVVEKVCTHVLVLHQGHVVAYDTMAGVRRAASQPSLEAVFTELTQQTDTVRVAGDILSAMSLQ